MPCADTQASRRHAGQLTVEVRSGSGSGTDCNLAGGNNQPHVVVVTNLEVFPAWFDCNGAIMSSPPTAVEFQSTTHPLISATQWMVSRQRVGNTPSSNSVTLNHVELVSRFPAVPVIHTRVDANWVGHYLPATVDVDITVQT